MERAKKSVSVFADKNNIIESARAIARNTPPPTRNGKRPRERERETDARLADRVSLGNKNWNKDFFASSEKKMRGGAHGNENFDDDGKYKEYEIQARSKKTHRS